jgi:hypothetical protein
LESRKSPNKGIGYVNVIWTGNELESLLDQIGQMSGSWISAIVDEAGNGYG